jgi:hypothetical protein
MHIKVELEAHNIVFFEQAIRFRYNSQYIYSLFYKMVWHSVQSTPFIIVDFHMTNCMYIGAQIRQTKT